MADNSFEKMQALLFRKKPRDFFDLYDEVKKLDARVIQRELKLYLPVSYDKTIAQWPKVLTEELHRL